MKMIVRWALAILAVTVLAIASVRAQPQTKDVMETAIAAPQLKVFVAVLREAGLPDAVKAKGPFTVFAPSDDAFKKIPAETLQILLKDRKGLTDMLNYHIVAGQMKSAEVGKQKTLKTLQGDELKIETDGGKVKLNGTAAVVKADVLCTNGVIHVIDTVMLPPKK
jgi:uncharacterized surface protein with fasciclin (FAS1) repeats